MNLAGRRGVLVLLMVCAAYSATPRRCASAKAATSLLKR